MIPNSTQTLEVKSNLVGEATQFSVDHASLAKIMGVLTNLYTDPEGAVVREYLSNALDSQTEAQEKDPNYVWRPIEVSTPSHFTKEYKVRDFGTGMSSADLHEIYSKYGKSTKENTNTQTGMLGLGSKCALTYTGQFTVTGYKDGRRTRALITKDGHGVPSFTIVDERDSDEPTGVEISVPVRDRNSFAEKTDKFLRWWKPGQVIVNGAQPSFHGYEEISNEPMSFTINDKIVTANVPIYHVTKDANSYGDPNSYVVMGNVPYSVNSEYIDENLRQVGAGIVAYVPMGAVEFPPSREELTYTPLTVSVIKSLSKGLFEKILAKKLESIENAPDHKTAWFNYVNLDYNFSRVIRNRSVMYQGLAFNATVQHEHQSLTWDWQGHGSTTNRQYLDMANIMQGGLIVTGFDVKSKASSYFKKKVAEYMRQNSISNRYAILTENDVTTPWVAWISRIDVDTIKNVKLPKDPNATPRTATEAKYDTYRPDASIPYTGVKHESLKTVVGANKETVVYVSPTDFRDSYHKPGTNANAIATKLGSDYILVVLAKNRFEKFLRTHPNAITLAKAFKDKIDFIVNATTDNEFLVGKLDDGERQFLKTVPPAKLKDPDLLDLATLVQSNTSSSKYADAIEISTFARKAGISLAVPERKNITAIKNPAKRYPLINTMGSRQLDHLIVYINAVYEQEYAQP